MPASCRRWPSACPRSRWSTRPPTCPTASASMATSCATSSAAGRKAGTSRRPVAGLGRHRHRPVRMPDAHRPAVRGQGRRTRAAAQPGQELGMVRGRPRADHAPDRRRQVVRRRSVRHRRRRCSTGRTTSSIPTSRRSIGALAGNLRRRHHARGARRLHDQVDLQGGVPDAVPLHDGLRHFCPGPAHILKPQHPKYKPATPTTTIKNAFPPEYMNIPVMGAWVPVEYRPDDIIVMRRNPYYWKVDEAGNQLPYLNEMHYRLSTWADRDVQAVAGTGDFSNLEQAESYVEALKRSADPNAPARLAFGARTIGYALYLEPLRQWLGRTRCARPGDPRTQPQPRLPQGDHLRDRSAASRRSAGQGSVHRHLSGRPLCRHDLLRQGLDRVLSVLDSTAPRPARRGRSDRHRRQRLRQLRQPAAATSRSPCSPTPTTQTDKNLAEGVIAMMDRLGIRVIAELLDRQRTSTTHATAGKFDWLVGRNGSGADLGGAEHRRAGSDRPAHRLLPPRRHRRHARPAAVRAGDGRHRQRVHRQPRCRPSAPS